MAGKEGSLPEAGDAEPQAPLAATPKESMGRSPMRELSVGSTGHGRHEASYRLVFGIAKGGMGEVFLAHAEGRSGPRKVIIKRLLSELRENKEYREMFRFEAEVLTRLSHPNIVAMVDLPLIDGVPCIALEYVRGRSLAKIMERLFEADRKMPAPLAAKVLLHVLEALQHAHEVKLSDGSSLELVHRDVTPGNILVSFTGDVKLTDFGIAKGKTAGFSTTAGIVKGKARYLSPEQILGERATPRSDVFSASCVGVEMLSGVPLFERAVVTKTLEAIVQGLRPGLNEFLPDEATALIPVLERGIARDPSFRHASARQMAQMLQHALDSMGGLVSNEALGAFVTELFTGMEEPWEQTAERPTAVEAENPIYEPAAARDETVRDPSMTPSFDESTDERLGQARIDTMIVRERDEPPRDAPDRQATVLEGEEVTLHLGAVSPLSDGHATEIAAPMAPEPTPTAPETPSALSRRPSSAVLRVTMPKDPAEPRADTPVERGRGRPSVSVQPLPLERPQKTGVVKILGREAPLLSAVALIFAIGAISGVVVTRFMKARSTPTFSAIAPEPALETATELIVPTPPEPPPTEVLEEAVAQAEPEPEPEPEPVPVPGVLTFVYPKGARVRLDGEWQKNRIPLRLEADEGSHEIEVQHKRRRYRLSVEVKNGEAITVDKARLSRAKR
jgi:serine/threonine protein kinase